MANTYRLIEAQTLGSNQASVTLGAGGTIPQTYTDLQVLYSTKHTSTTAGGYSWNLYLTFNGATSRYYELLLYNAYGSLGSTSKSNVDPYLNWSVLAQGSGGSNTFSTGQFYITNYTSSNPKSISSEFVSEDNGTAAPWSIMNAGLWDPSSNAPITSMTISASSIMAGSTFYLYGIKNS